jgi:hypothetical protein
LSSSDLQPHTSSSSRFQQNPNFVNKSDFIVS